MQQLITRFNVHPYPTAEAMGQIMAKWVELSGKVRDAIGLRFPKNATLEWTLVFEPTLRRSVGGVENKVTGRCSVTLNIPVRILTEKGGATASLPLTLVQNILIEEDGSLFWYRWIFGNGIEEFHLDIAMALVTGECDGRNYQYNHIPSLASS